MTSTQLKMQLAQRRANGESWLGLSQHYDADAVTFRIRTPGYRRRDVAIDVRDRVVIVRGERTDGWLKTRSKKSFLHTFQLPEALDEHDVCASFAGEVLQLKVGKKPYARRRLIRVHAPEAAHPGPKRTTYVTPKRESGWFRALSRRMSELLTRPAQVPQNR